jgi:hypothetical protein
LPAPLQETVKLPLAFAELHQDCTRQGVFKINEEEK